MRTHPYGKDNLPTRTRRGRWRVSFQYRVLRQTGPIRFSPFTGWEAPDPVWWVGQCYALVDGDLRGAGTSDGVGALMSEQEGDDVHDLVEWAAAQSWSNGAMGLIGVSYLAISPWRAEVVPVDVALGPSATMFHAGEQLRLVVAARWLWPRSPLTGHFPAAYRTRRKGSCTLHWGPGRPAHLLLPVVPRPRPGGGAGRGTTASQRTR